MQEQVLEYFEAYFGGTLNESISDEDIMDAVYDLVDLTEAVSRVVLGEGIFNSAEKRWQKFSLDQRQKAIDHTFGKDNDYSHGNLGHWMKWDDASKKKLKKSIDLIHRNKRNK